MCRVLSRHAYRRTNICNRVGVGLGVGRRAARVRAHRRALDEECEVALDYVRVRVRAGVG